MKEGRKVGQGQRDSVSATKHCERGEIDYVQYRLRRHWANHPHLSPMRRAMFHSPEACVARRSWRS